MQYPIQLRVNPPRIVVPAFVVLAGCLLMAQPLLAADNKSAPEKTVSTKSAAKKSAAEKTTGNLVTVHWLEKNLTNPGVVLIDASSAKLYAAQHIPGAASADFFAYGVQDLPLPKMEELYQSWGVSPGKKIVIYDQGGAVSATRVFFTLYYHGFPASSLFILDGGLSKWQASGFAISKEATPAKKGSFKIGKLNEEARVRLPEVLSASGDLEKKSVLIDALSPNWHFGEVAVFERNGHLPNGILLPAEDFYNPDKTFKSPEEIRRMLQYVGVKPDQNVYTYCGGGVAATVPYFAMKFLLNYPTVKVYKESAMGWMQDERQLPVWTYDAPFLLRETGWLQFWGGHRLRSFGGGQVSIVDVRPAEEYSQGHLPFALNVPAELFRKHLNDPAKLAELLGPAGVDPSHEAVVVSGAGVTRDAALAFAMLEKLGQHKVSLLVDSSEKWAPAGLPPTKQSTVVGPKKSPQDLSVLPTTYSLRVRDGVIYEGTPETSAVYPKVYIASGKALPAKPQEGKVVHVPFTDLLNPDGTPKPAKDIWNILAKAGVPRYAELVCIADDPGEAAANYFLLKLMGFPDVKVQAM